MQEVPLDPVAKEICERPSPPKDGKRTRRPAPPPQQGHQHMTALEIATWFAILAVVTWLLLRWIFNH